MTLTPPATHDVLGVIRARLGLDGALGRTSYLLTTDAFRRLSLSAASSSERMAQCVPARLVRGIGGRPRHPSPRQLSSGAVRPTAVRW